jgi:hypothetical protein
MEGIYDGWEHELPRQAAGVSLDGVTGESDLPQCAVLMISSSTDLSPPDRRQGRDALIVSRLPAEYRHNQNQKTERKKERKKERKQA